MTKEPKSISVVTIPLITEKWQEDILTKRMECCRNIYNVMLGKKLKDLRRVERDPLYKESLAEIKRVYSIENEKEKAKAKKEQSFKDACDTKNRLLREAGFSEFDLIALAQEEAKYFPQNVSSTMAAMSIAKPMWAAFNSYLYKNGEMIHFKKKDSLFLF